MIGAVGAAIDYSRANAVKAAMQSALDSTALMLARDAPTIGDQALDTKARAYFLAMFTHPQATNIAVNATFSSGAGSQIVVTGSAKVPTTLMSIAGYTNMTINGEAAAKWGSERLRVALALDVTGSMASAGKMTALVSATKNLLDQLKAAATTNGDVYVSIIPFNKGVNVGKTNSSQSWIDWTEWEYYNGTCSKKDTKVTNQAECLAQGGHPTWTPDSHSNWNGCVMDRGDVGTPNAANYDRNVTAPSSTIAASRFPAENYGTYVAGDFFDTCPAEMAGLTYDWSALTSLVNSLVPVGNTNQPIGLVWAWQSLVGGGPLTAPTKNSNYTYREAIILMSDGLNTENRWSTSQVDVDKRMYDAGKAGEGTCANIKAANVTVYTVHVNTSGDPMSTLLQNCASGSDKFWMITSASDFGTVFKKIGTDITKLRVAR